MIVTKYKPHDVGWDLLIHTFLNPLIGSQHFISRGKFILTEKIKSWSKKKMVKRFDGQQTCRMCT